MATAKFYRLLNKFLALTNTRTFLSIFLLLSVVNSVFWAILAVRYSWLLWICVASFLSQAIWAIKILLPNIIIKQMVKRARQD